MSKLGVWCFWVGFVLFAIAWGVFRAGNPVQKLPQNTIPCASTR